LNFAKSPISNSPSVISTIQGPIMRKSLAVTLAATTLTLGLSLGSLALAADAADPTVHQIYEAAQAGRFDQAQQMMDQVLRDHPESAKAHYVQAELYAKQGKTTLARAELAKAEQIDPGLTHENPRSVQELKSQLGLVQRSTEGPRVIGMSTAPAAPRFPWGMVLILAVAAGVLWMLFRRRSAPAVYPAGGPVSAGPSGFGGAGGGYAPGPGYGAPPGGGIGSGIAGGLASGLAVGAGVVAGEELMHHVLDGRRESAAAPPVESNDWNSNASNSDMGGSDFGVNDPGSWDDSGGGGGGGGDDWT
jgi:hypothetical protein